ncbi:MAG: response regulator [Planctomycetes bacterium]|nr:response regulator [Planctomycetota bacterium]
MTKKQNLADKEYFSTSEVAELVNMHRNTIIMSIKKGKLLAVKTPGGHARISREELMEFSRKRGILLDFDGKQIARGPMKVLIVDDDVSILLVVEKGLKNKGYNVRTATNGYEAGYLTSDFCPDVILLDIMLPDINGVQVCSKIRSDPRNKNIKIIAISAVANNALVQSILDAGADDFMPKPISNQELVAKIESIVPFGVKSPGSSA